MIIEGLVSRALPSTLQWFWSNERPFPDLRGPRCRKEKGFDRRRTGHINARHPNNDVGPAAHDPRCDQLQRRERAPHRNQVDAAHYEEKSALLQREYAFDAGGERPGRGQRSAECEGSRRVRLGRLRFGRRGGARAGQCKAERGEANC
jgi:hypothetical protein